LLLNKINEIFTNFNEDEMQYLIKCEKRIGGIFFAGNSDVVLNKIQSILGNLYSEIETTKIPINETKQRINDLKELKNSLENNYENIFDNGTINKIISFLNACDKKEKDILFFIRNIGLEIENIIRSKKEETQQIRQNTHVNSPEIENADEEIIEENVENFQKTAKEIIELFKKYGYETAIKYFSEDSDLFKYGKPDKIEEILKSFKEYNIDLLSDVRGEPLVKVKNNQLIEIFLHSEKEVIDKIFSLSIKPEIAIYKYDDKGNLKQDENGNPIIDFNFLLTHPSRFIRRKRRYKKRGNEKIEITIDSKNIGFADDYIENIKFFNELGVDIAALHKKFIRGNNEEKENTRKRVRRGTYFDRPHELIVRTKNLFDFYGVKPEDYRDTLSCFNSNTAIDTLDIFIELNLYDYAVKNISRLTNKPYDPIFYRIVRTYQLAKTPQQQTDEKIPEQLQKNSTDTITPEQKAKQFLFRNWHGDDEGNYLRGVLDTYIVNPERVQKNELKLNTRIDKTNGAIITKKYKRDEVLTDDQQENFKYYDELVSNNFNVPPENININSPLYRSLMLHENPGRESLFVYQFGEEPNQVRISKKKFLRIYNTLCKNGQNLENDSDCILYALTYNSIITAEQFKEIQKFVDRFFKNITKNSNVKGRK
jgi:hypothetical protein